MKRGYETGEYRSPPRFHVRFRLPTPLSPVHVRPFIHAVRNPSFFAGCFKRIVPESAKERLSAPRRRGADFPFPRARRKTRTTTEAGRVFPARPVPPLCLCFVCRTVEGPPHDPRGRPPPRTDGRIAPPIPGFGRHPASCGATYSGSRRRQPGGGPSCPPCPSSVGRRCGGGADVVYVCGVSGIFVGGGVQTIPPRPPHPSRGGRGRRS